MRTVRAATFVVTSIWLLIQPALAENRIALVIGNGSYEKVPELPNPPRDAADIARALERLNFKVTQTKNATAHEMRKAIVDFGRAAEGAEMAVVFYAGHGMEVGGENWLIPVNAELRSDADIESEAVSLRSISLQVSKARQLGLVILDACRNNPFAAKMKRSLSTRAVARGLAPTEPSDNVLIAYAARDGTTASDGEGRNSPFTAALLRNIETPGLEISFLFRNVRDEVMAATKREQQPFVYGSLSKEAIYLKPMATLQAPMVAPTTVAKLATKPEEAKEKANSRENGTGSLSSGLRNVFSTEDAQRVAATGADQKLKMPPFAMGQTKSDVPDRYLQFVGIWSNKDGFGKGTGRHVMLIVTEVTSDGIALGYYLWGPPKKLSWQKETPAGYVDFASKINNGKLEFKSGDVPMDAKVSGSTMTFHSLNPSPQQGQSKTATIKLSPLWRLSSQNGPVPKQKSPERRSTISEPTIKPKTLGPKVALESDTRQGKVAAQSMEDRYRACRKLVKGFAQREACARNGGI
ncbi:caspase family protein [Bradyrhizobium sp. AUGA SZCCT0182]|uniref:caspase family protein n=1 Tax=Bradyrhizobium sp. AUGA SZCCT0182 TaxID=2807667 RepID=UPI001BA9FB1D|nr:caspase family protein [Bradyrhizobium sp. AUGA SZCCT0182]MBR1232228.1 caspase family protein [Bradyrhizobium sp. AUGA SZCCT0182]